jgi:hypothetical protein
MRRIARVLGGQTRGDTLMELTQIGGVSTTWEGQMGAEFGRVGNSLAWTPQL